MGIKLLLELARILSQVYRLAEMMHGLWQETVAQLPEAAAEYSTSCVSVLCRQCHHNRQAGPSYVWCYFLSCFRKLRNAFRLCREMWQTVNSFGPLSFFAVGGGFCLFGLFTMVFTQGSHPPSLIYDTNCFLRSIMG